MIRELVFCLFRCIKQKRRGGVLWCPSSWGCLFFIAVKVGGNGACYD